MAVGLLKLSQNKRNRLAVVFVVLNVLEIILGATMTGTALYIGVSVAPIIQPEKPEINFVFVVYDVFGMLVIFNWLAGIKICDKCIRQAHKKSTRSLLRVWYCTSIVTVIVLIKIANISKSMNIHIVKSMKNSLQSGMNNYLTNMSWKETIDEIQYNMECCGISSYQDWHEIQWLNKYAVDEKTELVKGLRTSQEHLHLPVTPWSCCRVDFPMQCFHDPIQQAEYAHVWVDEPAIIIDSINTKGCLEKLKKPISWAINGYILVTIAVTILHIFIFLLSRILYTSSRNAVLLGDPEGIAPGWILGRGDCGCMRGKTLHEIMGIKLTPSEEKRRLAKTSNEDGLQEDSVLLIEDTIESQPKKKTPKKPNSPNTEK